MKRILLYVSVFLIFSGCTRLGKEHKGQTVFRYNESAGISSLDPAFARNQANIWVINQLFNNLIQFDSSLNIMPCIAQSWEISPDGLHYRFLLRQDVYFHDDAAFETGKGRKLIASDVAYSLKRLMNPVLASPGAWVMNSVAKISDEPAIQALNDSILDIFLEKPFPPFLGMLGMQYCAVVPHEAVEYYKEDFRSHPVGTGPFVFNTWKEGVKLVLLRNPTYFETSADGERLPFLDAVSVSFIIDKQSAFLEFVKGKLDFMSGLDAGYKDELLTSTGKLNPKYADRIHFTSQPYLNTEYLGFLTDTSNKLLKGNPLSDLRIRQAINMGFDRNKMIRYLRNGIGQPANQGIIPAGMPGHAANAGFGYDYRPDEARKLLTEAGFPSGKGLPPITLSTNASYLDLCQFIQSELAHLGINLKIDVSPPGTLRANMAQARVTFFRGSWIADYPDAENYLSLFYSPNRSPQGPNYTQFNCSDFDRLYQKAIATTDERIRIRYYREMDSLMMEQSPVVVLYYDQVLRFSGKNIAGLGSNPLNLLNLKTVKKNNHEK